MDEKKYSNYVEAHREVKYSVSFREIPPVSAIHKWVGAQNVNGCIYGIPNDMASVLKYTDKGISYLGVLAEDLFKWTGGCIWNDFLYGFPRSSNCLLKMSLDDEIPKLVKPEKTYSKEHHYGGICTKDGIIYQPPRDSDHILVWDLRQEKSRRIYLKTKIKNKNFRYCGSILHPDGNAYFLPEVGERVIRFNPQTERISQIGDPIDAMVFDAKVAADGNIYGFSAYCDGILKIDVIKESVEMIHQEICPGAYGTKMGVNGHLYSIPGNGSHIWDFDPLADSLESIYEIPNGLEAKYAGGTTMRNGDIIAVPAKERQLLVLKTDRGKLDIPEDIYQEYFVDCY